MKIQKKAFTLIELIVVITIMVIMSMAVYAPYQHYQTKQKVRNSAKIVTQTLSEARNLSINGVESSSGNLSIGVYFGSGSEDIILYQYPYSETISDYRDDTKFLLKVVPLEPGVQLTQVGGQTDALFVYSAITGSGTYSYYDGTNIKSNFSDSILTINLGFNGVTMGNLIKTINYYTQTYVGDVQ